MEDLEIDFDPVTKIGEAPLRMKSNNGTFLVDDFGRQRMQPDRAAPTAGSSRWKAGYDFLRPANGKKLRVPFDQFSSPLLDEPGAEAAR